MKKNLIYLAAFALTMSFAACGGQKKQEAAAPAAAAEAPAVPAYKIVENPQVDLSKFKKDAEGYVVLFDGTS